MKCGKCGEPVGANPAQVTFELTRSRRVVITFCSVQCAYWGGVQHARTGFVTTVKGLKTLFREGLEVAS